MPSKSYGAACDFITTFVTHLWREYCTKRRVNLSLTGDECLVLDQTILIEGGDSCSVLDIVLFLVLPYLINKTQRHESLHFPLCGHTTTLHCPSQIFAFLTLWDFCTWIIQCFLEQHLCSRNLQPPVRLGKTDCFFTRVCFCQHINQLLSGLSKVVLIQGGLPQSDRKG